MKLKFVGSSLGAIALASTVLIATAAHAHELDVCATGCDHTTITDAIDAAVDGDTIHIAAGEYAESLLIDKSLTLIGPNSGISPNLGGGPDANPARGAEAVLKPPPGSSPQQPKNNNPGAHIKGDVGKVEISGLTIDMSDGIDANAYIWSGYGAQELVLSNNIFKNAGEGIEGSIVVNYNKGDLTLDVRQNRFLDRGFSNGVRLYNPSQSSTSTVLVEDNVWLDNAGWATNFASTNGVTTGRIANNWVGNSTPSQGHDAFGLRQTGFLLYGEYAGIDIEANTFSHLEDAAVNFFDFSGTASITKNTIDHYFADEGFAAVRVRPGSVIDGVHFQENCFDNSVGSSSALGNQADAGAFEAELNWWGQDSGPTPGQVTGPDVNTSPWFAESCDAGNAVLGVPADGVDVPLTYGERNPNIRVEEETLIEDSYYVYRGISSEEIPADVPFESKNVSGVDVDLRVAGESVEGGPFEVCLDASEGQRLWHLHADEWVDITAEAPTGQVCGTATGLGLFVVAAPVEETPETPETPEVPETPEDPDPADPNEVDDDRSGDEGEQEEDVTPLPDVADDPRQDRIADGGLGAPVGGFAVAAVLLILSGAALFLRRRVEN